MVDFVHVVVNSNFVKNGGPEIAAELEKSGYAEWGAEPDATSTATGRNGRTFMGG